MEAKGTTVPYTVNQELSVPEDTRVTEKTPSGVLQNRKLKVKSRLNVLVLSILAYMLLK